jgi:hypothetical protein
MVIYRFASNVLPGLFAFAGDRDGTKLPPKYGPWDRTGRIQNHEDLPHQIDRGAIEQAIAEQGYQLWRMKKGAKKGERSNAEA